MNLIYDKYESPLGLIILESNGEELTGCYFKGQKNLPKNFQYSCDDKAFYNIKSWLDSYFDCKNPEKYEKTRLIGSYFSISVWKVLETIEYGQTITYGEIAKQLSAQAGGKKVSAQAVGRAVGSNPVSIFLPCHRVIGAGGLLVGYAGGIEHKRKLLELEGHTIVEVCKSGTMTYKVID